MSTNNEAAAQLLALAERCEKAEGPDRQLDAAIYYDHLGHCRHARTERTGAQSDTGFDCLDCGADSWGNLGSKGQRLHDAVPAYTTSIDAALTLVPEGMDWFRERGRFVPFIASVDGPTCRFIAECDNSFALALVAAALRARATETDQ